MNGRYKKALFGFVGSISSFLFGTATEQQLQAVSKQVSNALHEGGLGINEIQHQIDSLSSLSKLTNERIDASNRRTQKMQQEFSAFAVKMKSNLDSITRYTLLALKKLYFVSDMNQHLQSLLQDLEQVAHGKLEPGLVGPDLLKQTVAKINKILEENFANFQIIMTNPHYFYTTAKVAAARINQSLVIEVQFQLSSWDSTFDIYKLITTKVPVPGKDYCTEISNLPKFIAIGSDRENFMAFEYEPRILDHMIEGSERPIVNSNGTCIAALFDNDPIQIHKMCKTKFFKNPAEPSALRLSGTMILITNIEEYKLDCGNSSNYYKAECNFCIINAPCTCTFESEQMILPAQLQDCEPSVQISTKFLVNLKVLYSFFNESELIFF